jgi:hypothetical protein
MGAVFDCLTAAQDAAGPGWHVVRLAPLARWIVVSAAEVLAYGLAYGWELER